MARSENRCKRIIIRDAPLDFQRGRKLKKNHPRHEDGKKIAPEEKNHPRKGDEKKIHPR